MSELKELWLQNTSGLDINLSDLGVKVPANKTVNVYKVNPYVTEAQVKQSLSEGSVFKRLNIGTLKVVSGQTNATPHTLNHLKESTEVAQVTKTKSSVVIDTKGMDVLDDEDLGDIADYGFEPDVDLSNVAHSRTNDGSVVVNQRQGDDALPFEVPAKSDEVAAEQVSTMSQQSMVVMSQQAANATNPVGPISEAITPPAPTSPQNYVAEPQATEPERYSDHSETEVVAGSKAVAVEKAVEEESEAAEEEEQFDSQVATKDDSGSIVMKFKEEAPEDKKD